MRPAWFKLLLLNSERHRFGMTLPFLVGALQEPSGQALSSEAAFLELRKVLESMRDETPPSHVIRIAECDRLHQPVAAPINAMFRLPDNVPIVSPRTQRSALFVAREYLESGDTLDAALDSLWRANENPLSEGRYSYRGGAFQSFDAADRAFVEAALSMADDDEA
jgi:hypothetical protein